MSRAVTLSSLKKAAEEKSELDRRRRTRRKEGWYLIFT